MKRTLSIFVSSKMQEMREERERIKALLPAIGGDLVDIHAYVFEHDEVASDSSIQDRYLNALEGSNLYLGLFWLLYGEYTIDEFDHATKWGIDRHIYVKDVNAENRTPELARFLEQISDVEKGLTPRWYRTLDEFDDLVERGIQEWLLDRMTRPQADIRARWINKVDDLLEMPEHFVGRTMLLEEIRISLEKYQAVLLHGPQGMGKSALAAAYIASALENGRHRALWLGAGDGTAEEILNALALSFSQKNIPGTLSPKERCAFVSSLLSQHNVSVVVLDNLWNESSLEVVQTAIPKACKLVACSRQRLPNISLIRVGELSRSESLELLRNHARRTSFTEDQNTICELLGDNAFAVRLAGMQLHFHNQSEREFLDNFSGMTHTLDVPRRFAEEGQKSVAQLLETSLNYLKTTGIRNQQALGFLLSFGAFFSTHITVEMLSTFMNEAPSETEEALNLLLKIGLVEEVPATSESIKHFRIHDLTYDFLRHKVIDNRRDRALDTCLEYAGKHGGSDRSHFNDLEAELQNLLGAARWSMLRKRHDIAEQFAWWLYSVKGSQFLQLRAHYLQAVEFLEMAANAARSQNKRRNEAVHTMHLGQAHYYLQQYELAHETLMIALEIGIELNNAQIQNISLGYLGHVRLEQDAYEEAFNYYSQALSLAQGINDVQQIASWHGSLGLVKLQQGEPAIAIEYFAAAKRAAESLRDTRNAKAWQDNIALARQRMGSQGQITPRTSRPSTEASPLPDKRATARGESAQGMAAQFEGDHDKALAHYKLALKSAEQTGDRMMEAEAHNNLGLLLAERSLYDEARTHIEKALEISLAIGSRRLEGTSYNHLGLIASSQADYPTATVCYQKALDIATEIGAREDECLNIGALASVLQSQGQYEAALLRLMLGSAIANKIGNRRKQADFLTSMAQIHIQRGNPEEAINLLRDAIDIEEGLGDRPRLAECLNTLGTAQRHLKQVELAIETFDKALEMAESIDNKRLQDTVLGNRGLAYADAGMPYNAVKDIKQALELTRQTKHRQAEGNHLSSLGSQCMALNIHDLSIEYLGQAHVIAIEIGDAKGEAMRLGNLGAAANSAARFDDAIRYYNQARDKFLALGLDHLVAQTEANIRMSEHNRLRATTGAGNFLMVSMDQAVREQPREKTYQLAALTIKAAMDYARKRQLQAAEAHIFQAIKFASAINAHNLRAEAMMLYGEMQALYRRYNEALLTLQQTAAIALIVDARAVLSDALIKTGNVYRYKMDKKMCLRYYHEALELGKQQYLGTPLSEIEEQIKQVEGLDF